MCAVFVIFWLEKHDVFKFCLFFASEYEALFAWLNCINDLLKACPLAGHLYRVSMQKVPQIPKQKQAKSKKIMFFQSKSDKNSTH